MSLVAQEAGLLKNGETFYTNKNQLTNKGALKKKFQMTNYGGKSVAKLVKENKLLPGDIVGMAGHAHTMIYAGKKNGKHYFWSGGKNTTNTGEDGGTFKDVKKFYQHYGCSKGNCKVGWVIHPK